MNRRHLLLLLTASLPACASLPAPSTVPVWRTEFRELEDGSTEVRGYNRAGELIEYELLPKWSRT